MNATPKVPYLRITAVGAFVLAACAAPPAALPDVDFTSVLAMRPEDFPHPPIPIGFAAPDDGPMRVGDAALLGVDIHRDGAIDRQTLLLEVAAIPRPGTNSRTGRVTQRFTITTTQTKSDGSEPTTEQRQWSISQIGMRLSRHTADGTVIASSETLLFEEPLRTGWWPYTLTEPPKRGNDLAFALTLSLQELATGDPLLEDLLFQVVDKPSLLSIATHFGVKVVVSWTNEGALARSIAVPWFAGEVRNTRCNLRVQGDTAACIDMLVADPRGAHAAGAGLVGLVARHPQDKGRYAVVRLLATRRGPAP